VSNISSNRLQLADVLLAFPAFVHGLNHSSLTLYTVQDNLYLSTCLLSC
jgi:hypothetical protein